MYDLEKRTEKFSEDIVVFSRSITRDPINLPIIVQLVRSSTSVGANYCEANGASSKRDFTNKIYICKKEAKETKYWLKILEKAIPSRLKECEKLWQEAHELTLIFSKIASTSRKE